MTCAVNPRPSVGGGGGGGGVSGPLQRFFVITFLTIKDIEAKFWLIVNGLTTNLWISTKLNIVPI